MRGLLLLRVVVVVVVVVPPLNRSLPTAHSHNGAYHLRSQRRYITAQINEATQIYLDDMADREGRGRGGGGGGGGGEEDEEEEEEDEDDE